MIPGVPPIGSYEPLTSLIPRSPRDRDDGKRRQTAGPSQGPQQPAGDNDRWNWVDNHSILVTSTIRPVGEVAGAPPALGGRVLLEEHPYSITLDPTSVRPGERIHSLFTHTRTVRLTPIRTQLEGSGPLPPDVIDITPHCRLGGEPSHVCTITLPKSPLVSRQEYTVALMLRVARNVNGVIQFRCLSTTCSVFHPESTNGGEPEAAESDDETASSGSDASSQGTQESNETPEERSFKWHCEGSKNKIESRVTPTAVDRTGLFPSIGVNNDCAIVVGEPYQVPLGNSKNTLPTLLCVDAIFMSTVSRLERVLPTIQSAETPGYRLPPMIIDITKDCILSPKTPHAFTLTLPPSRQLEEGSSRVLIVIRLRHSTDGSFKYLSRLTYIWLAQTAPAAARPAKAQRRAAARAGAVVAPPERLHLDPRVTQVRPPVAQLETAASAGAAIPPVGPQAPLPGRFMSMRVTRADEITIPCIPPENYVARDPLNDRDISLIGFRSWAFKLPPRAPGLPPPLAQMSLVRPDNTVEPPVLDGVLTCQPSTVHPHLNWWDISIDKAKWKDYWFLREGPPPTPHQLVAIRLGNVQFRTLRLASELFPASFPKSLPVA